MKSHKERRLSLKQNFLWALLGNFVLAGCSWGVIVALSKFGTPTAVGQIVLGLAISGPVIQFFNMGLTASQATDANRQFKFGEYFGLRIVTTTAGLLLIVVIIQFSNYDATTAFVVFLIALAKVAEALSTVMWGYFQQRDRLDLRARSQITKGYLSLGCVVAAVYLTRDVVWAAGALAVSNVITFFIIDVFSAKRELQVDSQEWSSSPRSSSWSHLRPSFNTDVIWRLAWISAPIGLMAGITALVVNIPRFAIERFLGTYELGIYGAIAYFMVVLSTIMNAVDSSAKAPLARHYSNSFLREYVDIIKKSVTVGLLLGLLALLVSAIAGRYVLTLFYTAEYAGYVDLLIILMLASTIGQMASSLSNAIVAARKFMTAMIIAGMNGAVVLLSALVLVPKYGVTGGAWALCIGYAARLIVCIWVVRSLVSDNYHLTTAV